MQAAPRLILLTPEIDSDDFARELELALDGVEIAAVIVRLATANERTMLAHAKTIVGMAQGAGAATLLQGSDDLVGRSGADGVHVVDDIGRLDDAVQRFHPEKMVGAGRLQSRHDCMLAGEAGVDYLLFGDGQPGELDALIDRTAWWAEIFNSPCAALAPSLESVPHLARAGADFIALGDLVWRFPEGPREAVRRVIQAMHGVAA